MWKQDKARLLETKFTIGIKEVEDEKDRDPFRVSKGIYFYATQWTDGPFLLVLR